LPYGRGKLLYTCAVSSNGVALTGKDGKVIIFEDGRQTASVDGVIKALTAAPAEKDGVLYVPLRFLAENLGVRMDWEPFGKIVTLTPGAFVEGETAPKEYITIVDSAVSGAYDNAPGLNTYDGSTDTLWSVDCPTPQWIVYDLKMRIFEAMQKLSVNFYTSKRTGQLMNRVVSDASNIYWFFVDGLPFVIINVLMFSGVIAFMCALNLKMALVCIVIVPITIVMFRFMWTIFRRFHHKNWVYGSQLNSMVSDSVNGQRVIKAFAREEEEAERFAGLGGKEADINKRMYNMGFTAFPLIYMFMFIGQVIVTTIGGMMVINKEITIGTLLTFIAFLSMLYGPLEFISWVSNWWARCVDSAQRVFEIIDAKPDIAEPEDPAQITQIKGDIAVKDVWFEYEPATPILKGLSLTVESGKLLGIVGKTGAGKSTLANLIARLYDVKEGSIEIDGVDVRRIPLGILRNSIGIVSQDIYLFIGSIADNIRYAKPNASIEEVIRAAKIASAHEFIMKLPDAYETRVGAGGQDLSGGERQRLSIARTIIQNPRILILDEATAAMDTETEVQIQESLAKLQSGRTTIAIAHRLSTLRDADSLAVINDGKVVESGVHADLMAKRGEYQKLYSIQMEGLKMINMDVSTDVA